MIFITPGDPAGIGPEIVSKALRTGKFSTKGPFRFVCIGAAGPFKKLKTRITPITEDDLLRGKLPPHKKGEILLLPAPRPEKPGLHVEGYQAGWSIEKATRLILAGHGKAIVTGPISKERLNEGGFAYSGHTDFLADLCHVPRVTMMLANDQLRITLVTVHMALRNVPQALSEEKIHTTLTHTAESLRNAWGIRKPRIAVAALNPHAGESGMFGDEDDRVVRPALASFQTRNPWVNIDGPLPADTLFAQNRSARGKERYDAVVCMYHDQGLIPVKLLDFPNTVNVTLGLPIIRTSVDHGVAFDIAGKNKADPSSLKAAMGLAIDLIQKKTRKRHPL